MGRVHVQSSRWEGMSIVLIEALAAEATLVVSNIPEIAESVRDGENGLLVETTRIPMPFGRNQGGGTDGAVRQTLKKNARRSVEQFERSKVDARKRRITRGPSSCRRRAHSMCR